MTHVDEFRSRDDCHHDPILKNRANNRRGNRHSLTAPNRNGLPPTSVRGRRLTYENHGLGTDLGHSKTAEPVCYKPKTSRIYPLWPVPCNFSGSSATFRHSSPHRGSTGSPGRDHVHVPLDEVLCNDFCCMGIESVWKREGD